MASEGAVIGRTSRKRVREKKASLTQDPHTKSWTGGAGPHNKCPCRDQPGSVSLSTHFDPTLHISLSRSLSPSLLSLLSSSFSPLSSLPTAARLAPNADYGRRAGKTGLIIKRQREQERRREDRTHWLYLPLLMLLMLLLLPRVNASCKVQLLVPSAGARGVKYRGEIYTDTDTSEICT